MTAAVNEMFFQRPVKIGDRLNVYTVIEKTGRTSITLRVDAYAQRYLAKTIDKVTSARFVMVALDADGKPTPVPET